jgi:hypothetical protein
VQNFSSNRKSGTLPYLKLLTHWRNGRGAWKKRYGFFGADGAFREFDTACNARVCLTIREFLNMDTKLNIPANPDGSHKLDKIHFTFGLEGIYVDCTINLDGSFTCTLFMPFEERILLHCSKQKRCRVVF